MPPRRIAVTPQTQTFYERLKAVMADDGNETEVPELRIAVNTSLYKILGVVPRRLRPMVKFHYETKEALAAAERRGTYIRQEHYRHRSTASGTNLRYLQAIEARKSIRTSQAVESNSIEVAELETERRILETLLIPELKKWMPGFYIVGNTYIVVRNWIVLERDYSKYDTPYKSVMEMIDEMIAAEKAV